MSGFTSSELGSKNHGRKSPPLSQGQEPPWAFLPLAYRASPAASAMSGHAPPPSASTTPPIPFTAHHLPPAAPSPTQRLRVPAHRNSPPPSQGHITPWSHTTQTPGISSLPGNLGYFGQSRLASSLAAPSTRSQPQLWTSGQPKPSNHPVERNSLFSLQMLVSPEQNTATIPGIRSVSDDYQQETMDLSSHSNSTANETNKKDNLRNGAIVSNGETNASIPDELKSGAKTVEVVSVISSNPLREVQEPAVGTVLNCSSKQDFPKSIDLTMDCSSSAKNVAPEISKTVEDIKPLQSTTSSVICNPAVAIPLTVEKIVTPQTKTTSVCSVDKDMMSSDDKCNVPSPGTSTQKPIPSATSKVSDEWGSSKNMLDNVESILEDMFQIEEDKSSKVLVEQMSVIVKKESSATKCETNAKYLLQKSEKIDSLTEKINEEKLAEMLKVEDEPDLEMECDNSEEEDNHVSEEENHICDDKSSLQNPSESNSNQFSASDFTKDKEKTKNEKLTKTVKHRAVKPITEVINLNSSDDDEPLLIEEDSEMKSNPSSQPDESGDVTNSELNKSMDDSESVITIKSDEPSSNPFIEVESELEKMFAGIVETKNEQINNSKPNMEQENSRKKLTTQDKKRNRPKAKSMNSKRGSDSDFEFCPKKKGRQSAEMGNKKLKKSKSDSGRDSPAIKKGRGSFVKDASNDSSSALSAKSKGPLIHIEGSRENPSTVVIVNSGIRTNEDDDNTDKSATKPAFHKKSTCKEGKASKIGLYNSTLSARYDSQTPDVTWVCVFCKRGPHCAGGLGGKPAGDLFGPYVISSLKDQFDENKGVPSDRDVVEEQKKRGGGKHASLRSTGGAEKFVLKIARKHKRTSSTDSECGLAGLLPVAGEKNDYEVWTHEQCAVWAPGVYLVGTNLVGLQEAVWASVKATCSKCGDLGASINCITRGCNLVLHYGCAVLDDWLLNSDTFIAKCQNHCRERGFFSAREFVR